MTTTDSNRRRDQGRARQAESLTTRIHDHEPWTDSDDAVVSSSVSLNEMARITGRSYWAVAQRRKDIGVAGVRQAAEDDERGLLCPCGVPDDHLDWCP